VTSDGAPTTESALNGSGRGLHPHHPGFDGLDVDRLRRRPGVKWARVPAGGLAAWVADMDFPPCPAVEEALRGLLDGGDLGYPDWLENGTPVRAAFARRMAERFGWEPDPLVVREVTDLIQGVQVVLHLATDPGDAVAMHVPAYPPFLAAIKRSGRRLVPIPMESGADGWGFDVAAMDDAVAAAAAKVLLLVNPQNPTGRVFTGAELDAMAGIARRHDLLVISDEIHADLVYRPHRHLPFAARSDDAARRTVTLTSASKAFNLAGLRCAVAHVGAAGLLATMDAQPPDLYGAPNLFGVRAATAAWSDEARPWLDQLVTHLDVNRRRVAEAVPVRLPGARVVAPEGTYLAWIDVRDTDLGADPFRTVLARGVRLSPGPDFGPGGEGFLRLNFATSSEVLDDVLDRLGGTGSAGTGRTGTGSAGTESAGTESAGAEPAGSGRMSGGAEGTGLSEAGSMGDIG
jgi:cystathionine beta-lyase